MKSSAAIRAGYLSFFKSKIHHLVASAPIVIKNDPTLMFTNAGMNQFKDYFLGNKKSEYARIADTQKCLRVSGKHNDLEEVGVDHYHHTMFEMLGNWSFGDPSNPAAGYFKQEAIAWSWELLTDVYGLDKNRIYVTIFEGDEKEGLPKDEEACSEWKKHIAPERILLGNKKDNFWEMGDTGPCGPCTEIHYDCRTDSERAQTDGAPLVNNDHPQVIEIWNNVFIQFNRKKDGSLELLPAKHVDTGMGLERLVRVLQNKQSNYDTDIFSGTIREIEKLSGIIYDGSDTKQAIAFRVIADHIRAIGFTIADGQLPANTGAGYVIRRILRRAVRYYYSYFQHKEPLLTRLVPVLAEQFKEVFPELKQQEAFVSKVVMEEELSFLRTLEGGLKRMDELINESRVDKMIAGEKAFELYDTYGFPYDLTTLIAAENNLTIDKDGFDKSMTQQKERSRSATGIDTGDWISVSEEKGLGFVGYDDLKISATLSRYRKINTKGKTLFQLVLNTTPFYAESGGQVGDSGYLLFGDEKIIVFDTRKENDLIVHYTEQLPQHIDADVEAVVDTEKRIYTMYNHTATHLLHAALRQVLGTHVAQKGSLVNETGLRFDLSHFAKITDEEIAQVTKIVNQKIRENIPVNIRTLPKEEAMQLGAMALFGEKYGEEVRVVTIDPAFSIELCGGTHVPHTGMMGLMTIVAESAVAAGVRRIEAITGPEALRFLYDQLNSVKEVNGLLKTNTPLKAVEKLIQENAELRKRTEMLEARELVGIRNDLLQKDAIINNINFIGEIIEVNNPDALKRLCLDLKNHLTDFVVVLCANIGGKPFVAVSIAENVVTAKGLDAAKIIKELVAPLIGGGGGGQKSLATAGGQNASKLAQVIEKIKTLL